MLDCFVAGTSNMLLVQSKKFSNVTPCCTGGVVEMGSSVEIGKIHVDDL